MQKIIVIDFAGTLILPDMIEKANRFRAEILQRALPTAEEHGNPDSLYKANNQFVENLTGLTKKMIIAYRGNDGGFMQIKGERFQNQLSTNLFQIGMFMTAKREDCTIFKPGIINELRRAKNTLGYKLAIVSGVRTDIISGMLQIANCPIDFDHILGQPPILGVTNRENFNELKKFGTIDFVIGDKLNDIEAGKEYCAKTIFATWGHPTGEEQGLADYTITEPAELRDIL